MRRIVLAMLLTIVSGSSGALDANSVDLGSGTFDASSRKERIQLAKEVLADVNKLADVLSSPRPADVTWVDEEQAAIQRLESSKATYARRSQFYQSPEFQHVKVYGHLREIKNALNCVIDSTVQLRREMYCWGTAAFHLGNRYVFGDGVQILQRAKRISDDSANGLLAYEIHSRNIQEYLVLPYLNGKIGASTNVERR